MSSSKTNLSLQYREFGDPYSTLELVEGPLKEPKPAEVLLQIEAAPINPADLGRISGSYGDLAELPAVAGLEGVATIAAKGAEVTDLEVGQRVIAPASSGTWQRCALAPAASLIRMPEFLDTEQAAMAKVNPPTAWKLLHDFVDLQPGDWIVQNAATSAVGKLVIQFTRHLGFRTLNLVRSLDAAESLKALGATEILTDDDDAPKRCRELMNGRKARLGLNSVGAPSSYRMAKSLEDGAPLVTFGAMDRELAPYPTRHLIFNDLQLRGFWVSRWYREAPREEIESTLQEIFQVIELTKTKVAVAKSYPLAQWKEAIEHSTKAGKAGKVLFKPEND